MEKTLNCYCGEILNSENSISNVVSLLLCPNCERVWGETDENEYRLLIPNFPQRTRTANEIKNQIFLCKRCYGATEFIGTKHRVRCLNSFCQYEWYESAQGVSLYENQLKHRRLEIQQKMITLKSDSDEYAKCLQELIDIQRKVKEVKEEKL
jgi:hypothetical protein